MTASILTFGEKHPSVGGKLFINFDNNTNTDVSLIPTYTNLEFVSIRGRVPQELMLIFKAINQLGTVTQFDFCVPNALDLVMHFLKTNTTIKTVWFNGMLMTDTSLIGDVMLHNTTIKSLCLTACGIRSVSHLGYALSRSTTLKTLYLTFNDGIGDWDELWKGLCNNRSLVTLYVSDCLVEDKEELREMIKKNRVLKYLDLTSPGRSRYAPILDYRLLMRCVSHFNPTLRIGM